MTIFRTTPAQVQALPLIEKRMKKAGVDETLVVTASKLARTDQGVFDLMALWRDEDDEEERKDIIADIKQCVDDYQKEENETTTTE